MVLCRLQNVGSIVLNIQVRFRSVSVPGRRESSRMVQFQTHELHYPRAKSEPPRARQSAFWASASHPFFLRALAVSHNPRPMVGPPMRWFRCCPRQTLPRRGLRHSARCSACAPR
jgi:hypothetical protein